MHPRQGQTNPVRPVSGQARPARHGPNRRRPALDRANEVALFRGPLCIRISMAFRHQSASKPPPLRGPEKKLQHGQ